MGNSSLVIYLRAIATTAEATALKEERGQHWPGEVDKALGQIQEWMKMASAEVSR